MIASLVTNPTHGTVNFHPDGSFTYTPSPGFSGIDSFTYRVTDGFFNSNTATVTITAHAPSALDDFFVLHGGSLTVPAASILANDVDSDGDSLTATLSGPATHGTVSANPGGGFTFVPDSTFIDTGTFSYRVSDGFLQGEKGARPR